MSNTTHREFETFWEYKAGVYLMKVVPPIIILFGTVGNILSIIVLTRKSIRKSTTSVYLMFLTSSDFLALYTGLLRHWLIYLFDFDIRNTHGIVCKLHIWLVYSSLDFSAWILIALTLERVTAVWWPFSANRRCSKQRAIVYIIVILVTVLGLNAHMLYGMVKPDSEQTCVSIDKTYSIFFRTIWSWMDLCVFCLIPLVIIVVGNSLILFKIVKSHRKAKARITLPTRTMDQQHTDHQHSSMTAMLFTLNTVFLLTTLPVSIYSIGYQYWIPVRSHEAIATLELWWAIVNMLMYCNNALNFLLYCVSGSRFRQEVKRIFCRNII